MPENRNIEEELGIANITANEVIRPSKVKLEKIKEKSDENLKFIFQKIKTNDDEEKRNLVVNLIAALDYYIHEIIIWGIIEITENKFPKGEKYDDIKIPIKCLKDYFSDKKELDIQELRKEVIEFTKKDTYQKWKKIKKGLEYILPKYQWLIIQKLDTSNKNEIDLLEELNKKRNDIVHNYDRDYHSESLRNDFILNCEECFKCIEKLISLIHSIVVKYDETEPES